MVKLVARSAYEQSYYRWRKEYGGLRTDQAKRLKDLEKENGRLRKAISDLTLDKPDLERAVWCGSGTPWSDGKGAPWLSPARRRQCVDHLRPNWESPSDVPVLLQANIAQPSARDPVVGMMKRHSRPRSSADGSHGFGQMNGVQIWHIKVETRDRRPNCEDRWSLAVQVTSHPGGRTTSGGGCWSWTRSAGSAGVFRQGAVKPIKEIVRAVKVSQHGAVSNPAARRTIVHQRRPVRVQDARSWGRGRPSWIMPTMSASGLPHGVKTGARRITRTTLEGHGPWRRLTAVGAQGGDGSAEHRRSQLCARVGNSRAQALTASVRGWATTWCWPSGPVTHRPRFRRFCTSGCAGAEMFFAAGDARERDSGAMVFRRASTGIAGCSWVSLPARIDNMKRRCSPPVGKEPRLALLAASEPCRCVRCAGLNLACRVSVTVRRRSRRRIKSLHGSSIWAAQPDASGFNVRLALDHCRRRRAIIPPPRMWK